MTHSLIRFFGCRQHNLQNLSLSIHKNVITVITGVSGSGKSSLVFDTLFAEGQRRYLEYLSSQANHLVKQMPKPAIDFIEGLSPTLAVGQGHLTLFSRGTVATYTDIYDLLALLFANIGEQHSPLTGKRLIRYSREEIIEILLKEYPQGTRLQILSPIKLDRETAQNAILRLQNMGFIRFKINGIDWMVDHSIDIPAEIVSLDVIVDRIEIKEGIRERLAPSIETCLDLSSGVVKIQDAKGNLRFLTEVFVCPETGFSFPPLQVSDFNFNSSRGACPVCQGRGGKQEIDPFSLFENSEIPFTEQLTSILEFFPKKNSIYFLKILQQFFQKNHLGEETLFQEIPKNVLEKLLYGSKDVFEFDIDLEEVKSISKGDWKGIISFLNSLLDIKKNKNSLDEIPFANWKICPGCKGARLKPESLACLIKGKNIAQWCELSVDKLLKTMQSWEFTGLESKIIKEILPQIEKRLHFLEQVGLRYLELNRSGKTLSDGESHRIHLASQIGAKLSGLIYILDEPSLGLHPRDLIYLHNVIKELQQLGNTIVMVEHEKRLISEADDVIELGPGAGREGGRITFQGTYQALLKDKNSLTGQWLTQKKKFPIPLKNPLPPKDRWMEIPQTSLHNLKNLSLKIPLGCLVGFCGVSGSGKSTLVIDVIGAQIQQQLRERSKENLIPGSDSIKKVVIGKKLTERYSSRSIIATYVNLMTPLRQLYASTKLAKARGYNAARFSLNKRGGRCEACEGLGEIKVNMQFMSDLYIPCEVCKGQRYNYETLQILWENRSIANALELTVEEAAHVFRFIPNLFPSLELMKELGLGYLTLGQSFHTLSGGEIQRLKLITDLALKSQEPTLYILDEPSAGLHMEDVSKLILVLQRLLEQGHSIFIIEHHIDLLKQALWLIELGPEGGPKGGHLIFEGTPKQLSKAKTPTGLVFAD